jgi:hypothetical protein
VVSQKLLQGGRAADGGGLIAEDGRWEKKLKYGKPEKLKGPSAED